LKLNKLNKPSFCILISALLVMVFVSKAFSQKENLKDLKPPSNDLPALNELPLDSKIPLPKAAGPEGKEKTDGEKVDGLYQTYLKPEPTADGYVYDPVGRRDPFRPYRDAKVGIGALVVQRERPLEPLESFDVKTLQVVAIIWGISKPKALIQDPNKVIHTVVKGMRIGKNDGVIAEIREGEVVIIELFDQNGKIVKEPFILPIKR
jgi:type IV pilus assembly protein PilP